MSIRDALIFVVVFGLLPFCVYRPYVGLLTWTWLSYMNPHRLTWGVAYSFPFAQLTALATVIGLIAMAVREHRMPKLPMVRESVLLFMLWTMFLVSTFFALLPDLAWPEFSKISKILFAAFLTIMLIDDEKKLRYLILVIAFSLGFYGVKGGLFTIFTGGQSRVYGPGGFIGGNNSLGLALNMVLPMLFFLAQMEKKLWARRLLYGAFFLTIIAVLFTYSRGAALGLVVVLGAITLYCKFQTKLIIAICAIIAIPIAISLVPDQLVDRIESIDEYEEDGSAQARLRAWRAAWLIAVDRPLVGGGFQVIDDKDTVRPYSVEYAEGRHAGVHSVIFELLGENGFIAATIFLLLVISTMSTLKTVRRNSRASGEDSFRYYANMLQVGIIGYLVTGLFLEMASFNMFYQFVAIAVVLKELSGRAIRSAVAVAAEGNGLPVEGSYRAVRHSGEGPGFAAVGQARGRDVAPRR